MDKRKLDYQGHSRHLVASSCTTRANHASNLFFLSFHKSKFYVWKEFFHALKVNFPMQKIIIILQPTIFLWVAYHSSRYPLQICPSFFLGLKKERDNNASKEVFCACIQCKLLLTQNFVVMYSFVHEFAAFQNSYVARKALWWWQISLKCGKH